MSSVIGIDTSNYTTSVCVYDSANGTVYPSGKLLPVREGELGLRQSDAVFEHVRQFGEVFSEIPSDVISDISAVSVSVKPSERDRSYMPCFLVGKCIAEAISHTLNVPTYEFSHQAGHIMAALYSANKRELIGKRFLAFHISGGTTDLLLVDRSENDVFDCKLIGGSTDLKMGQATDRLGQLLDLPFPSGRYLDELSKKSTDVIPFKTNVKGLDCSISGFENQFKSMLEGGASAEDVAFSFFYALARVIVKLTVNARAEYGELPVVFSGGVASNSVIRSHISDKLKNVWFAEPKFSSDNAAGIAILGYLRSVGEI